MIHLAIDQVMRHTNTPTTTHSAQMQIQTRKGKEQGKEQEMKTNPSHPAAQSPNPNPTVDHRVVRIEVDQKQPHKKTGHFLRLKHNQGQNRIPSLIQAQAAALVLRRDRDRDQNLLAQALLGESFPILVIVKQRISTIFRKCVASTEVILGLNILI
ncbi:MAG: hypothetical protein EZS28_036046, partial [Streblomastix strix]